MYHIADAPCHGTRFHDVKVDDDYAKGDLHGCDIAKLLRNLHEDCKISSYTFLHIKVTTHKMLQEFKRVSGPDSSWIQQDEFQGRTDVEDIPMKVMTACKTSISHSLSTMFSGRMKFSDVKFVPRDVQTAMPDWDSIRAQEGEEFGHCIRNIREANKVVFTVVSTLHVQPNTYYNMEKVLKGLWTKFNSNAGYVSDKGTYTDTLQAFSHWTHERSRGMIMVTDLQGVQTSSEGTGAFLLCDPAIHSRDVLHFTRTNLGEQGFQLFDNSHKCNTICQKLGLKG
ncbi:hypothetical protein GOP47_0007590 [Adiantum capillus-veneris]|uniref:Alpha-type protein kinase domain-containing protein n=1 Tax=Adiantum capillus-veneris TaxID=13818 RepID=A0A9D4V1L5_ADICA|nr:hypothetical protein GOP47_0007590 [Adiantum capillus-veneris]